MALSKFDPPSFESVPFVRLARFESIKFSNGSRRHIRNSPPFQEASCSTRRSSLRCGSVLLQK